MSDDENDNLNDEPSDEEEEEEFGDEEMNERLIHLERSRSSFVDYSEVMQHVTVTEETSPTKPSMTKYEYARIRGVRLEQLGRGAIPYINMKDSAQQKWTIEDIFAREFHGKRLPMILKRRSPNCNDQYFRICDMDFSAFVEN
jgi:hypothetical protein